MNYTKNDILEQILLEVCAHPKVSDGTVNFNLQEHVDALVEVLKKTSMPVDLIKSFTNKLNEGKHPDRQAFNREGFLVTFPNPEYKKQALASGEYSNQDPTNGTGGMHLVKKVEPTDAAAPSTPVAKEPVSEPAAKSVASSNSASPSASTASSTSTPAPKAPDASVPSSAPSVATPPTPHKAEPAAKTAGGATQYSTGVPISPSTDLNLDKISDYRDPSLEWSHNKKWQKRENNNYYDAQGNLKAITGLDGTVVPVSEEERVDLKKFIEDKKKEKLGIEPSEEPTKKEV